MAPRVEQLQLAVQVGELLPNLSSEWSKIVEYSGLPPTARSEIAGAVARYRAGTRALNPPPSTMRNEIGKLATRAEALAEDLARLSRAPQAAVYLTLGMAPKHEFRTAMNEGRARVRAEEHCAALRELAGWIKAARARIAGAKPGAHTVSFLLKLLVLELDEIRFRHTGRHIMRSGKRDTSREYITTVCNIADPDIRKGAIEEAMKAVIKARSRKTRPK